MGYLTRGVCRLLHLPFWVRLCIVCSSFVLCMSIYLFLIMPSHNGSVLIIPIVLAAWMFRYRGLFLCALCIALTMLIARQFGIATIQGNLLAILDFLSGLIILLFQGGLVILLRSQLERLDAAQKKIASVEQAMQVQREALSMQKHQLMNHISHELRTPLTEVYGYLQLLQVQQAELDHTRRAIFLKHAMHGCEELQALVTKILQMAPARNILRTEAVALQPLLQSVIHQLPADERQSHPISVHIDENLCAGIDPRALSEILFELLSNACIYTPAGTPVIVSAACDISSAEVPDVLLSVQDKGPGIPLDEQEQLFEEFTRSKQHTASNIRGAGVGLYKCRQLVEAMGGRIWVESTGVGGEGSSFWLQLPGYRGERDSDTSTHSRHYRVG